jgi:hypothetical protein
VLVIVDVTREVTVTVEAWTVWVMVVDWIAVVVVLTVVVTGSALQPDMVSSTRAAKILNAIPVFLMFTSVYKI